MAAQRDQPTSRKEAGEPFAHRHHQYPYLRPYNTIIIEVQQTSAAVTTCPTHTSRMGKRRRVQMSTTARSAVNHTGLPEVTGTRAPTDDSSDPRSPTPLETDDCPFKIAYRPTNTRRSKRKRQIPTEMATRPFFAVQPRQQWTLLKQYKHFRIGRELFHIDDLIFVNHDEDNNEEETRFWVARVLDIRAVDEIHVYLRVYWWYWPEDLPMGRCPWHGNRELIASNHLEIIDAMTVAGHADVRRWEELDEEEDCGELFWRQTYDYIRAKLLVSVNLTLKGES